jgi:hypothetical protein
VSASSDNTIVKAIKSVSTGASKLAYNSIAFCCAFLYMYTQQHKRLWLAAALVYSVHRVISIYMRDKQSDTTFAKG